MKIAVLSYGSSSGKDWASLTARPAFRKATRCMMFSYIAAEEALGDRHILQDLSVVLGTSYGELEVTKEFLLTLADLGHARPMLFQNSLHNATLGFLGVQLGVTGPSVTVSKRYFTAESCLESAAILLQSGASQFCLALTAEAQVPALLEGFVPNYPKDVVLSEGAAALLLATETGVKKIGAQPLAWIEGIEFNLAGDTLPNGKYHDSDGLENLIQAIQTPDEQGGALVLVKPDRTSSRIRWRRV